jgi:hypothetical protein
MQGRHSEGASDGSTRGTADLLGQLRLNGSADWRTVMNERVTRYLERSLASVTIMAMTVAVGILVIAIQGLTG